MDRPMRMNELTRYLDTDAISGQLERLQSRLSDLRGMVPYRRQRRGYALPAALILGGIAAIGAIAITSIVLREANTKHYPEGSDYEG
jgi:hypothetical protein